MTIRLVLASLVLVLAFSADADDRVEKDVVYGRMSGLALLMDVYHPKESIGRGVLFVAGSAWDGGGTGYTDFELKRINPNYYKPLIRDLTDAGFVVFSVNHRAAPVHRYPSAVDDVRRAVRFVRANAERFSIDPEKMAAVGHSSGGYLSSLLGVLDESQSNPLDATAISGESSKVQVVVAISAPQDLTINSRLVAPFTVAFMGERPPMDDEWRNSLREGKYAEASPISHVSRDDAAFLFVHAIQDDWIDVQHAKIMHDAIREAGLATKIVIQDEHTHWPTLDGKLISRWLIEQLGSD